jgi:hypothetical protein
MRAPPREFDRGIIGRGERAVNSEFLVESAPGSISSAGDGRVIAAGETHAGFLQKPRSAWT